MYVSSFNAYLCSGQSEPERLLCFCQFACLIQPPAVVTGQHCKVAAAARVPSRLQDIPICTAGYTAGYTGHCCQMACRTPPAQLQHVRSVRKLLAAAPARARDALLRCCVSVASPAQLRHVCSVSDRILRASLLCCQHVGRNSLLAGASFYRPLADSHVI